MTLLGRLQTAHRAMGAYDTDGIWQVSLTSEIPFQGTIQPATPNTVAAMAQGRENDGMVTIFSDTRLQVPLHETGTNGDTVTFGDNLYELIAEQIYDNGLLPHYKYLACLRTST